MYICEEHGKIECDWCDMCEKSIMCDCKDKTISKIKDISYECNDGERNITIKIHHCETCGNVFGVEW